MVFSPATINAAQGCFTEMAKKGSFSAGTGRHSGHLLLEEVNFPGGRSAMKAPMSSDYYLLKTVYFGSALNSRVVPVVRLLPNVGG
jgi:hypothetical protein